MVKELSEEIVKKLDTLIKLTAFSITKEDKTQTESILKLNAMGIGYRDIAKIIGTSESYVALIISLNKNKGKKKEQEISAAEGDTKDDGKQ